MCGVKVGLFRPTPLFLFLFNTTRQVDDLEVKLVDKNGFPSSIGPRGVRVMVTPQGAIAATGVSSPRGGRKNSAAAAAAAAKKDLSKKATHNPEITMPKFLLDLRIQGPAQANLQRSGGGGAGSSKAVDRAEQERAARVAKSGVALFVRADASDLDIAGVSVSTVLGVAGRRVRESTLWYRVVVLACVLTEYRIFSFFQASPKNHSPLTAVRSWRMEAIP